jgi:leader peptidase (prepilin peptidase)/N-methyltransferase
VTASAALLVWAPQPLIAEVAGARPRSSRALAGFGALAGLGALLVLFLPAAGLGLRAGLAVASLCALALAYIDVRFLVIPDLYSVVFAALGLVGPLHGSLLNAALGALLGGGLVWGVRLLWRRLQGVEGLGFGDVKLAAALGCLLGPEAVLRTISAAAILGAAAGLAMRRWRREPTVEGDELIPLGAALALCGLGFLYWSALQ